MEVSESLERSSMLFKVSLSKEEDGEIGPSGKVTDRGME
jgi:hypothetical protein